MSDFDFDKSFSEDFRQHRFEQPAPGKWESVAADLQKMENKKRRRRFALLCLPYLLAAASLGLFFWNKHEDQHKIAQLETHRLQLENDLKVCGQKNDALISSTYKNETVNTKPIVADESSQRFVFHINHEDKPAYKSSFPLNKTIGHSPVFSTQYTSPAKTPQPILPDIYTADNNVLGTSQLDVQTDSSATVEKLITKPASEARKPTEVGLAGSGLEITLPAEEAPIMQDKVKRPLRFGLGLNLSFESQFVKGPGNRLPYYANACFLFNKGWRLEAGFEMKKYKYAASDPSNSYPKPPPPSADYVLSKMETTYSTNVLSVGVHRNFRLKKRLQPSLLVELLGYQYRKTHYKYEYTSLNTALSNISISETAGGNVWSLLKLRFGTGLSYKILPWLEGRAQFGCIATSFNRDVKKSQNWPLYYRFGLMGYF